MTAGRPPKPLEEKLRTGNPGGRRLPELITVATVAESPPPPSSLKKSGKRIWCHLFTHAGIWLGPSDEPAVTLACELADQVDMLKRREAATKKPEMKLQWFWAVQRAQKDLMSAYSQLGLTPTARAKLGLVVAQAAETESRLTRFSKRAS